MGLIWRFLGYEIFEFCFLRTILQNSFGSQKIGVLRRRFSKKSGFSARIGGGLLWAVTPQGEEHNRTSHINICSRAAATTLMVWDVRLCSISFYIFLLAKLTFQFSKYFGDFQNRKKYKKYKSEKSFFPREFDKIAHVGCMIPHFEGIELLLHKKWFWSIIGRFWGDHQATTTYLAC